jgi:hypothetical protein
MLASRATVLARDGQNGFAVHFVHNEADLFATAQIQALRLDMLSMILPIAFPPLMIRASRKQGGAARAAAVKV